MAEPPLDQGGSQLPEVSREEILKQIFGDIGELIDDFTCAVESTVLVHGRMYITNKFICFYSNLFGLEKKIRIPYSHIKAITKENTAMVIPNAIAISTDKKDYIFRSFWDREDCFRILTAFLARFKGHSDPDSYKPKVISDSTVEGNSNVAGSVVTPITSANISDPPIISDYFISESGTNSNVNGDSESPQATSNVAADSSPTSRRLSVRPTSAKSADNDDVYDTESGFRPNSSGIGDQNALFEAEVAKSKLKILVVSETLPISVNDFYKLYISENCPFSFKAYHESVKDTNLDATPWSELSSSLGQGREIKFFKPVNLPGLASTRGVKVQRYRRFDNIGLILCSSTRLEDVPAADTFSVEDMISVKSVNPNATTGLESIIVEITFQVTFIKSTYMKYIIDRSTNFEMSKWLETFFAHIKKTTALYKEGKVTLDATTSFSDVVPDVVGSNLDKDLTPSLSTATESKINPVSTTISSNVVSTKEISTITRDVICLVIFLLLVACLIRSSVQWTNVNSKIADLEGKIEGLDRLLNQVLHLKIEHQ